MTFKLPETQHEARRLAGGIVTAAQRLEDYLCRDLSQERITFGDLHQIENNIYELRQAMHALEEEGCP